MLSTESISALAQAGGATSRALPKQDDLAKGDAATFRDFEALLIGEVLKGAQRTSLGSDHALSGGSAGKMYREMLMDALAAGITEAGGIGIADALGAKRGAAASSEAISAEATSEEDARG